MTSSPVGSAGRGGEGEMNEESNIVIYRLLMRRTQVICLAIAIALTIGAGLVEHWVGRICSFLCGALALCLLFFSEIQIDLLKGRVIKVERFLGFLPVSQKERPLTDFEGIRCYAQGGSEEITWLVALKARKGPDVSIRQFSAPPDHDCPEATEFARELSSLTGLKVIEPPATS